MLNPYFAKRCSGTIISPWRPSDLSSPPSIWLDDDSGFTTATGGISRWTDRSTNGWDFVQSTSTARPNLITGIRRRRASSFATNDSLISEDTAALDILRNVEYGWAFIVFVPGSVSLEYNRLFWVRSGPIDGARLALQTNFSKLWIAARRIDDVSATPCVSVDDISTGQPVMFLGIADYSSGELIIHLNGGLNNSQSMPSSGPTSDTASGLPLRIGGPGFAGPKDIYCTICGNSSLSNDDIDMLFGWAAWRYGLSYLLPSNHPYKYSAP